MDQRPHCGVLGLALIAAVSLSGCSIALNTDDWQCTGRCSGATPHCDLESGQCVECLQATDCDAGPCVGGLCTTPFGQQWVQARCQSEALCFPFRDSSRGEAQCLAREPLIYTEWLLSSVQELLIAGRFTVNVAARDACLTELASVSYCNDSSHSLGSEPRIPPACRQLFAGTTAAGGQCSSTLHCQPGHLCSAGGVCVPIDMASGIPCSTRSGCPYGEYCGRSGNCETRVANGGACDIYVLDACAAGVQCIGAAPSTCLAPGAGTDCSSDLTALCPDPATCLYTTTGTRCVGTAEINSAYPSCSPLTNGHADSCPPGEYCVYDATTTTHSCDPLLKNGSSCNADSLCAGGRCLCVDEVCADQFCATATTDRNRGFGL